MCVFRGVHSSEYPLEQQSETISVRTAYQPSRLRERHAETGIDRASSDACESIL